MTGRTHDLAAVTALGVVALIVPLPGLSIGTALVAVLANLIGGIAPDIDQPTAPFWRNLPIGSLFGRTFTRILGGHRFLTHSLVGVVLFGWAIQALLFFLQPVMGGIDASVVWWAFMIGIVSHLVMDSFTKEGVPWLLPIPVKFGFPPLRAWRLTTGKAVEVLVIFPGLVLLDAWLGYVFYAEIVELFRSFHP